MTSLTIENASIGYNKEEVQTAMNNLNTKCIKETIELMKQKMTDLSTAVDESWVGISADKFKKNLQTDVDYISKNLEEAYELLEAELYDIVNNMDEVDQGIVTERKYN